MSSPLQDLPISSQSGSNDSYFQSIGPAAIQCRIVLRRHNEGLGDVVGTYAKATFGQIMKDAEVEGDYVAVKFRGTICSLNEKPQSIRGNEITFEPVKGTSTAGRAIIKRSLTFLLGMACHRAFPDRRLVVQHGFGLEHSLLNRSHFCILEDANGEQCEPTADDIERLEATMLSLVASEAPIVTKRALHGWDASHFEKTNRPLAAALLTSRIFINFAVSQCAEWLSLYHAPLVPHLGILNTFKLNKYRGGFLLSLPSIKDPMIVSEFIDNEIIASTYDEYINRGKVLGLESVGGLNLEVVAGGAEDIVNTCEALHDKKLVEIAETIESRRSKHRVILIAGPSSSGKTTFAGRLCTQLKVIGVSTLQLSVDNYYYSTTDERHPRTAEGKLDFETIKAIQTDLLMDHVQRLLDGESVTVPIFDFARGISNPNGDTLSLSTGGVLVMEGLFCLDPQFLPPSIPAFRIYIAPLSCINLDDLNYISNQTCRVVRRIARDSKHRGRRAGETIKRWPSVRSGEERSIFRHIGHADVIFNSSLDYEFSVLKSLVIPLLEEMTINDDMLHVGAELHQFLSMFHSIPPALVPRRSILTEFIN